MSRGESKYDKVKKWLKTRQHFYSNLDYDDIIPLEIPGEALEKLNTQVGPRTQLFENTPYPIFQVEKPKHFNLEEIRGFLRPYSLTAYKGPSFWHSEKYGWISSIVITPRVASEIVELLDNELGLTYKEDYYTPCFNWAVNLDPNDAEKLLVNIRKLLEGYPVVPHLSSDIITRPSNEPSIPPEVYVRGIEIAPTNNKYDLLRFHEIDGVNYDLSTEGIIKELLLLDKQYGIDFIGPVEVQLRRIPTEAELRELEIWYKAFCPDGADYPENVANLAKGRIWLGWD